MKILHVVTLHTPTHEFGGPTRVALNHTRELRRRGHSAMVVALGDGFGRQLPSEVDGVPVRLFRARHILPRYEVSGITSPTLMTKAWSYVRSADVVHVHLMRDLITLPVALMALRLGRPLVLQTHGMIDPTDKRLAKLVDTLGVRRVLRNADAILYLTETERDLVAAVAAPRPVAPTYRLVNGVPQQHQRPANTATSPVVLYAARVQELKRPQDFVSAIPTVLRSYTNAKFVMAGPDTGTMAEGMLTLARQLGVAHAFDYVGALDHSEVLARMKAADVYVLPSIFEPFAVSILEAMSVGLPVVVTRTGGLSPDVAAAGAGIAVNSQPDADNGELVGRAILELLEPTAWQKASDAAWQLVNAQFTIETVIDELLETYARVTLAHR